MSNNFTHNKKTHSEYAELGKLSTQYNTWGEEKAKKSNNKKPPKNPRQFIQDMVNDLEHLPNQNFF